MSSLNFTHNQALKSMLQKDIRAKIGKQAGSTEKVIVKERD
ncbi:MAG: hypothetical protein ACE3JK_14770 [Sporolactobacillus sp.]